MPALLRHILTASTEVPRWRGATQCLAAVAEMANGAERPVDRAILGGFLAGSVGFAVAAGHQGALRALIPDLEPSGIVAFCASEEGGAHPRAIRSRLDTAPEGGYRLTGRKRWATLAPEAGQLLVVASVGWSRDRNELRLVLVPSHRSGIDIEPMPATTSLPELMHAEITFDAVAVAGEELRLGDAYLEAVKPFRTLEDLYVHAALLAHLLRIARHWDWPESVREELLTLLVTARSLAAFAPSTPELHLALAGLLGQTAATLERHDALWRTVDDVTRDSWQRDRGALGVAAKAREIRRRKAWEGIEGLG